MARGPRQGKCAPAFGLALRSMTDSGSVRIWLMFGSQDQPFRNREGDAP